MDDIMFPHVVKRYQNLNGEPFDQTQRKSLKVVHFYEVVEIDA
jgi:hypothetical protein